MAILYYVSKAFVIILSLQYKKTKRIEKMKLNDIIAVLRQVYNKYDNIRLGIAGSYANGDEKLSSDIDVVIDGDSMRVDIMEYIKSLFDITVDVLWIDLMKQEEDELDRFAAENGLPVNQYSAYKTVMQEVRWI